MADNNISLGRKTFTGNTLKLIAIITMFIDHTAYTLLEAGLLPKIYNSVFFGKDVDYTVNDYNLWNNVDIIMRGIGRLAFPIFIFLMLEGFRHTHNVWKYLLRMAVFAVISELPFNLMCSGKLLCLDYQNVYFTLCLGLLMMIVMEYAHEHIDQKWLGIVVEILILIVFAIIAYFIKCDYDVMGIGMIYSCYLLRNKPNFMWIGMGIAMLLPMVTGITNSSYLELFGLVSFFLIDKYNGERGTFNMKYLFYAFYPVHILVLVLIKFAIFG